MTIVGRFALTIITGKPSTEITYNLHRHGDKFNPEKMRLRVWPYGCEFGEIILEDGLDNKGYMEHILKPYIKNWLFT